MFGDHFFDPSLLTVRIPAFLFALTIHEYMHGWTAYKLGDDTAKLMGRLTLNPISHLDAVGTILMIVVGFGWAKPVPVNFARFRSPRRDTILVSLAGPLTNLVAACFFGFALRLGGLALVGVEDELSPVVGWLLSFACLSIMLNSILAAFNILPIPPLDGSKLLISLFPRRGWEIRMAKWEAYGPLVLFLLLAWDRMGHSAGPLGWYLWTVSDIFGSLFSGMNAMQLWNASISLLGGP